MICRKKRNIKPVFRWKFDDDYMVANSFSLIDKLYRLSETNVNSRTAMTEDITIHIHTNIYRTQTDTDIVISS